MADASRGLTKVETFSTAVRLVHDSPRFTKGTDTISTEPEVRINCYFQNQAVTCYERNRSHASHIPSDLMRNDDIYLVNVIMGTLY